MVAAKPALHVRASTMIEDKYPAVYMLANRYRGTIYVGVTSRLYVRVGEHKAKALGGFTAKYGVDRLVWYEHHHTMEDAIRREKDIKAWKRTWKIKTIESGNPDWLDLH
jgi:putative endonuclease